MVQMEKTRCRISQFLGMAVLAAGCVTHGQQSGTGSAEFDAASVKVSAPTPGGFSAWFRGGPGTPTPTKLDYHNASMTMLVARAYGVPSYLVMGPDWLKFEKYEIAARVAAGATPDDFREMLRNLLMERFRLQAHRETREIEVYALTVLKAGVKFKAHSEKTADEPKRKDGTTDEEGYPVVNGRGLAIANGRVRLRAENAALDELVSVLSSDLNAAVHDHTGLAGRYDYELKWGLRLDAGSREPDPAPDLFAALESQLGLRLEKRKEPNEVVVVDHAEKAPAGN